MSLLFEALGHGADERLSHAAPIAEGPGGTAMGEGCERAPALTEAPAAASTVPARFGARILLAEREPVKRRGWTLALWMAGAMGLVAATLQLKTQWMTPAWGLPAQESLPIMAPPETPRATPPAPDAHRPGRPPLPGEESVAHVGDGARRRGPDGPALRVTRRSRTSETNPQLLLAYEAYRRGDHEGADATWRSVLERDSENRQALLGLAGLAMARGDKGEARAHYLRLLERDPADVLALAGLLDTEPLTDPITRESRLKSWLAAYPDVGALYNLLGNHYVGEGRWSEARLAYARAVSLDKDGSSDASPNPDFAFNLAVTLEHLGRTQEALAAYQRAVEWASLRPISFDPALAMMRIHVLSGT